MYAAVLPHASPAPGDASGAKCRTTKTFPVGWAFTPSNLGQKDHVPGYAGSERAWCPARTRVVPAANVRDALRERA
jgi:hypothetical protein